MNDLYNAEEFAKCFSLRGYGRKKDALKWLEEQKKDYACDDDFQQCYYDLNPQHIGHNHARLWADGQNGSAPQNMSNSCGRSFNYEMRLEQKLIDATDKRIKRRAEKKED